MKMNETRLFFVTINKNYPKIDQRPKIIKYIKENIGTKLTDLGLREDFMNLTSKTREVKEKNK